MSLYESISNSMNSEKEMMKLIASAKTEYSSRISSKQDSYVRILELCPSINDEEDGDVLDFLEYLGNYAFMKNIERKNVIETYLISKGYKDMVIDFNEFVNLIIEFVS